MTKKIKKRDNLSPRAARRSSLQPTDTPQSVQQINTYSGPIPPPEILARFEEILPGSADRIISMAEEEGRHTRALEKSALESTTKETTRGQRYALVIGAMVLSVTTYAVFTHQPKVAMLLGGGTLVSLVASFLADRIIFRNK